MKAARLSNFNTLLQISQCLHNTVIMTKSLRLIRKRNFDFKTEESTKSFLSQNVYSNKQYIYF